MLFKSELDICLHYILYGPKFNYSFAKQDYTLHLDFEFENKVLVQTWTSK